MTLSPHGVPCRPLNGLEVVDIDHRELLAALGAHLSDHSERSNLLLDVGVFDSRSTTRAMPADPCASAARG